MASEIIQRLDKLHVQNAMDEAEKTKPSEVIKNHYERRIVTKTMDTNRMVSIANLKHIDDAIIGFKLLDWDGVEQVYLFEPAPNNCIGENKPVGRPFPLCTEKQRFEGYLATGDCSGYCVFYNNFSIQIVSKMTKTCTVEIEVLRRKSRHGFFNFTQKHDIGDGEKADLYSIEFRNGVEKDPQNPLCTMYTSDGSGRIGRPGRFMYTYEDLTLAPLVE